MILRYIKIMKLSINKYLINKYSNYHELVIQFYNWCKQNKGNKNSIQFTCDRLNEIYRPSGIPEYVYDYFNDILRDIDKHDKNYFRKSK